MDNGFFLRAGFPRSPICNRMSAPVRLSYVMALVHRTVCNYADCIYLKRPIAVSFLSPSPSFSSPQIRLSAYFNRSVAGYRYSFSGIEYSPGISNTWTVPSFLSDARAVGGLYRTAHRLLCPRPSSHRCIQDSCRSQLCFHKGRQ